VIAGSTSFCRSAGTFVDIPNNVLGRFRISGGSFLVSKGMSGSQKKNGCGDHRRRRIRHEGHREEVTRSGEHGHGRSASLRSRCCFLDALWRKRHRRNERHRSERVQEIWSEIGLPHPTRAIIAPRGYAHRGYIHGHNDNNKTPDWVIERLTPAVVSGDATARIRISRRTRR